MEDSSHSFSSYFKRATSPLVVLAILREKPMYGYEISSQMKARSHGKYTVSVLYTILYRLQEQGFVEIARTEVVDGRARSYYQITPAGRAYLTRTCAEYQALSDIFLSLVEGGAESHE